MPSVLAVSLPQVSRLALSGLRNWTTAASPSAVFAARHFRPFLPPRGHVELGEPWWIIPSELSVFTGYLSNNRFYPPPPKGKEVRAAPWPHAPALLLDPKALACPPPCTPASFQPHPWSRANTQPGERGPRKPTPGPTALPAGHHPPASEHVPPTALREDPFCPSGGRGLPDCHQRLLLHRDVPVRGPGSPIPAFTWAWDSRAARKGTAPGARARPCHHHHHHIPPCGPGQAALLSEPHVPPHAPGRGWLPPGGRKKC